MGSSTSKKPDITISAIRTNTEEIRSSLRRKKLPNQSKENLHQVLINNSKQLDTLRPKKSKRKQLEIDQLQKMVSDVSEELLQYNDDHLDKSADESHSFIHVAADDIKNTKKPSTIIPKVRKNSKTKITLSNPVNSLNEIEQKLARVKHDVTIGVKNEDKNILLLQKKKIEMLSTDLELVNIPETSTLNERKQMLEKDLYRYYQRIIKREKNQARLSRVNVTEKDNDVEKKDINSAKLKSLEIMMQDIHDVLQNTARGDDRGDMKALCEELNKIDITLNDIQDNSKETLKTKTLLMKKVDETKKFISQVIQKEELNNLDELMDEIDTVKIEIENENGHETVGSVNELNELKKKLIDFEVICKDNQSFKLEYLDELNNFLKKTDLNHDGVKLREKKLMHAKSVEDLVHLQDEWKNLEKNISFTELDEVRRVDKLLEKFEDSIRAKRKSLADLLQKSEAHKQRPKSDEIIRTSAKIYELPKTENIKSIEYFKKPSNAEYATPLKYGTLEHTLDEITQISDRVDEIGKDILNFKGTSEDLEYNFFKASLRDKKQILENISSRSSWKQVIVLKSEILEKIGYFDDYLKDKLDQNILEKILEEKLDNLNGKIRRFDGSYQNVQYKGIYDELTNCSKEAEKIDSIKQRNRITNRSSYLKLLLKEISHSDIPLKPNENLTDTRKIIAENKEYLNKVKEKLDKTSIFEVGEYDQINESLNSKASEIINLNIYNDTPKFQDVKNVLQDIDYCRNLAKNIKLKEETTRKQIIEDINHELEKIQYEILNFDGQINDPIYSDLMKSLRNTESKLIFINTNGTVENNLDISLQINLLKTRLEQVGLESGILLEIENRVHEILETISTGVSETDYDTLDEDLINLKIQLEKLEVSEKLTYRKIACLNYIEYLLKKINEDGGINHISRSVIV